MVTRTEPESCITMEITEEQCVESQRGGEMNDPERAASKDVLCSERTRTSLPFIVSWWGNYRRNTLPEAESDDNGVYHCIKQEKSPPPEEIELSNSVENSVECSASSSHHVKISRHTLKQRILETMKSTNSSHMNFLKDIEKGRTTVEKAEEIFSTSTSAERNIMFLWVALNKRSDLLQCIFKHNVDLNFSEPTEGFTALHLSAFGDCVDCAKFIISCGADVNFTPNRYTPLETACFHNSFKVAKLLLENGAKTKVDCGSPLLSAVKSNAIECVQLLISEGAHKYSGKSSLLIAAEMGHLKCIEILLVNGADPNLSSADSRNTALHAAADGGFSECVSLLLSKGADADARNSKGQTALHLAAQAQSVECVEILLKKGHCNPNSVDANKRTPLHSAVGKSLNACEITELLIRANAQVNGGDMYGYTPLHVAALTENTQCVQMLINNGADVSMRTEGGSSALGIIVRKTPLALSVLYKKFDSGIIVQDPERSSSKEVKMKLDFRIFLQRSQKGEINFLKTFLDEGQKEILEHPLCQAFLHVKWEKIRKYYIARMVFYGLLVLCLTGYVFTAIVYDCYKYSTHNTTNTTHYLCENLTLSGFFKDNPGFMIAQWYILLFFVVFEAIRKIFALTGCSSLKRYMFQLDNILEWFVLISSFLITYLFLGREGHWQNNVAAFAVLFAWINLMLLLGQLPELGSYVAMYIKVQKEFVKLFIAYACLLFGFTFSFCVIFPSTTSFQNPFFGFIQVIALMIGSVEYDSLVLEGPEEEWGFVLTSSAHITFLFFMLFVTIIMMNLLVGIAVRDIQGLEKTAGLSKLVRQTKLISNIELSLFNNWLPKYILMLVRHTALISPSGYRVVLEVKPLNHQEKRLPKNILKDAYEIGKTSKPNYQYPLFYSRFSSFIGGCTGSSAPQTPNIMPDESSQIQSLRKELENQTRTINKLAEEFKEIKSLLRQVKQS